ncbi:unnamed protein product, partial [Rotaria sp. Silwood1]
MNKLFENLGATHLYSTVYHPQTNRQIERFNATMDGKIIALCNERRIIWDEVLQFVTFNYNASIHATAKQKPFEMMHGRQATLPFDQQNEIISLTQDPEHSPSKIIKQLGSKAFIVQHIKKLTLTRQVTMDVIVPLLFTTMSYSKRDLNNPPDYYYTLNTEQKRNWRKTARRMEKNEKLRTQHLPFESSTD